MEENQLRNVKKPVSTNKDVSKNSSRPVTEGHPLMNVVILDNIIRYLKYEDLKNFRLVCQRWQEVSKNVFWKLSSIKVSCNEELLENELGEPVLEIAEKNQKLMYYFENTFPPPAGLPTSAIKFEGCINRRTLEYFWKERGSLTLTNVYFEFCCDPVKECIDLNRYLTPTLNTLNISFSLQNKPRISLSMLANIQNLTLDRCEIILDGKIVPVELDLMLCRVTYEGKQFKPSDLTNSQKILINDFVDFSKIKKLILKDEFWRLDVGISDAKKLEYLDLGRLEVVGLHNCQWKSNFVATEDCICIGDKMEINTIPGTDYVDIEIKSISKSLEHLWFQISESFSSLSQPLICEYPKLKSLTIRLFITRDFRILDFTNCTSLVHFQFSSLSGVQHMDLNRIILPSSVKNVKLGNIIPTSDVPCQLDTLILFKYPFSSVESVLHRFSTKKLAIKFDFDLDRDKQQMFIVNYWRNSGIKKLALGGIDWPDTSATLNSEFRKGVNKIGRFFLFFDKSSNGKGMAIDHDRFESLSSLELHKDLNHLALI